MVPHECLTGGQSIPFSAGSLDAVAMGASHIIYTPALTFQGYWSTTFTHTGFIFFKWKPNAHILEVNYAEKYFIFLLRQMIFK